MPKSVSQQPETAAASDLVASALPPSRREELLSALIQNTSNEEHVRILEAYLSTGTVEGAEAEFGKIIDEIIHED